MRSEFLSGRFCALGFLFLRLTDYGGNCLKFFVIAQIHQHLLEADFGTGCDIATLGHILHSEAEDRSRKLLKKTFRALKSGGVIAIAEWLVNEAAHRCLR